jgi:hypothetical protein
VLLLTLLLDHLSYGRGSPKLLHMAHPECITYVTHPSHIHVGCCRYMLVVEGTDLRRVMATEGESWFKKGQHDCD